MWPAIIGGGVVLAAGVVLWLRWRSATRRAPDEAAVFTRALWHEIEAVGPEYRVRGVVPGTFTMVIAVHGQEVPVPLEHLFHHYLAFPSQLGPIARQLLAEIEEIALERPGDHGFADAALRILPQICPTAWVFDNAPAFGDASLVHRPFGPDLAICYVIDDPWSVVFVCRAHLAAWGRSEDEIFHLANQNLRRRSGAELPMPGAGHGPVRVHNSDGYAAARVLLLDPDAAGDLLIAMPQRDSLYLGREADRSQMVRLMRGAGVGPHPVSRSLYRIDDGELVRVSDPEP